MTMKKYTGVIYCYVSPSKKKYVGLTTNEKHRRVCFSCMSNPYTHWGSKIDFARKKYGCDRFIYGVIEILENNSKKELVRQLKEREQFWIKELDTFKNGYNGTEGGDIVNINEEAHRRHSDFMKQLYGGKMPQHLADIWEKSLSKARSAWQKQVNQYTLDGEFVQTWNSIADAARSFGKKRGDLIQQAVKKPGKSAYGYFWKLVGDDSKLILNKNRTRKVAKYDLNEQLLEIYNSGKEAGEKNNCSTSAAILECCNKNSKSKGYVYTSGGYIFKYLEYGIKQDL